MATATRPKKSKGPAEATVFYVRMSGCADGNEYASSILPERRDPMGSIQKSRIEKRKFEPDTTGRRFRVMETNWEPKINGDHWNQTGISTDERLRQQDASIREHIKAKADFRFPEHPLDYPEDCDQDPHQSIFEMADDLVERQAGLQEVAQLNTTQMKQFKAGARGRTRHLEIKHCYRQNGVDVGGLRHGEKVVSAGSTKGH